MDTILLSIKITHSEIKHEQKVNTKQMDLVMAKKDKDCPLQKPLL